MFKWTAIYDDRTELKQFDGTGTERLFRDIDHDRLIAFRVDAEDGRHIIIDLKVGLFMVNGTVCNVNKYGLDDVRYRLIYFRRNTRNIGVGYTDTDVDVDVEHFVGFQFTKDGKNHQAIVSVNRFGIFDFCIK